MIVIVVALEKEIPPNIRNNFPSHWVRFSALKSGAKHQYKNRKILIVVTGMGHKCEPAIRWICSHLKPQHIVNLGSAGAPTYPRHQWVIAKPVTASNYFHEHSPLPLFPALSERPIIAPCSSVPITQFNDGLIGQFRCNETALQSIQESSTQPINNSNQHPKNSSKINTSKLFRAQPLFNNNLIIDMELNPIASVCNEYQCNFSSIKFITDHNNEHKSINFNESLPIFHKQLSPVLSTILNTEKQFGIIQKILHDHFFHSKNLLSTNHNHIGDSKSKEKNVDISKLTLNSTKTSNKLSPVSNETSRHYKTYKTKKSIDLASNTEYQQSKNIAITSMQIFKDRTVDNQELFPKISVIIPTHHRQQQTISAIESVITQCYAPHEIIVVDDGSQPPFEYPCPNVQIIRLDTNQGVSAARNIGIQQATGDAIAFLDSDDEWQPHHLLELVKTLSKSPWLQWVQSNEHWVLNGHPKNKKSYHQKPSGWAWQVSLERCMVSPSAVLILRQMFDDFGMFDPNLPACEDYDLWLRMTRHRPIGLSESPTMTKYAGHPNQLSTMPMLDQYRIQSLKQCWDNESNPLFKSKIASILLKKCNIFINGAKKRGQKRLNIIKIHDEVTTFHQNV